MSDVHRRINTRRAQALLEELMAKCEVVGYEKAEAEIAALRKRAEDAEADAALAVGRTAMRCAELETMREALALHEVGSAYAHRLAVMLECALLDPTGTWNEAHALLDEYRAACRAAAPMQEPPTFMGEPVVMPNASLSGGRRT